MLKPKLGEISNLEVFLEIPKLTEVLRVEPDQLCY